MFIIILSFRDSRPRASVRVISEDDHRSSADPGWRLLQNSRREDTAPKLQEASPDPLSPTGKDEGGGDIGRDHNVIFNKESHPVIMATENRNFAQGRGREWGNFDGHRADLQSSVITPRRHQ